MITARRTAIVLAGLASAAILLVVIFPLEVARLGGPTVRTPLPEKQLLRLVQYYFFNGIRYTCDDISVFAFRNKWGGNVVLYIDDDMFVVNDNNIMDRYDTLYFGPVRPSGPDEGFMKEVALFNRFVIKNCAPRNDSES